MHAEVLKARQYAMDLAIGARQHERRAFCCCGGGGEYLQFLIRSPISCRKSDEGETGQLGAGQGVGCRA